MSDIITDLVSGLKTKIESVLTDFDELPHGLTVEDNSEAQLSKKYAVIPRAGGEVPGLVRNYTIDHTFEIVLTNTYTEPTDDDSSKQSVAQDLLQKTHDLYKKLITEYRSISDYCLNLNGYGVTYPNFITNKNAVSVSLNILIRYRQTF